MESQKQFDIFSRPMAFVDLETTGLDERVHEIIEIGLVLVNQNTLEIIEEWEQRVKPKFSERSDEINRKINGFNEAEWASAPHLEEVIAGLASKLSQKELWSWNIQFEWRFLKAAFEQCGMELTEVLGDYHGFDVVPLAKEELRRINFAIPRFSLNNITKAFGLDTEPYPHRALNGAHAAFALYKKIRKGA